MHKLNNINKFAGFLLLAGLILGASPVLALDCSQAIPLACGDELIDQPIGLNDVGGQSDYCGEFSFFSQVTVYQVDLATDQQITATITGSPIFQPFVSLLGSCDSADCIDHDFTSDGPRVLSACLPAGTYYITVAEMTDVFYLYTIRLDCEPCDPVAAASVDFGVVKSLY